jgi:hypothetical protein
MTTFTYQLPDCHFCDGPVDAAGRRRDLDHWICRVCGLWFWTPADDEPSNLRARRRRRGLVAKPAPLVGRSDGYLSGLRLLQT